MQRTWKAGLLLAGGLMFTSLPAMAAPVPSIVGSWRVTFYLEPNHTVGASQCVTFVQNPIQVGEPASGRWFSTTFPGWQGKWIQEADHVRWYGFTGSLATAESTGFTASANLITGEFIHFSAANGVTTSSSGAWSATRVSSCANVRATTLTAPQGGDPSGK
ncbi:MAG: hypothetical protein KME17_16860 [Cyanosarcina radialis HA8281-LM2]|jgi:hypothetical protein|nr:hypothetical protein [Cyanosarcina radialis HA8281-LM2]